MSNHPDIHDQILFVAETVGQISERLDKIEKENLMADRSVDASKSAIDATATALNSALTGLRALNYHVLDNNLGQVSARVEKVAADAQARAGELAASIESSHKELANKSTANALNLAKVSKSRIELSKRTTEQRDELSASIKTMRTEIEEIQTALEKRITTAMTEFAKPNTFDPQGTWDAMTTYKKLSVVELNGSSYVSNTDDNKIKPARKSKAWTLIARRGAASGGGGAANFTGATASDFGGNGLVPAPLAGEESYHLKGDGTWAAVAVPGSGDVVGPASSTDNALVRWDATTGKLVQDSGVTVDDVGVLTIPSGGKIQSGATNLRLDGSTSISFVAGGGFRMFADGDGVAIANNQVGPGAGVGLKVGAGNVIFGAGDLTLTAGSITGEANFVLTGASTVTMNAGGSNRLKVGATTHLLQDSNGVAINNGTTGPGTGVGLLIQTGALIVTAPTTPASAAATGTIGTIAWDTGYLYVCTATDTWERVAVATW